MSERIPRITAKEMIRALKKLGFFEIRSRSSHFILADIEGKRKVTVPLHSGKILPIGTTRGILEDAEVEPEELREVL